MGGFASDGTLIYMCNRTLGTPVTITNVTHSGGVVTVTAANSFDLETDKVVRISGIVGTGGITELNGDHILASRTASEFTINDGSIEGTYVSGGSAVIPYTSRLQLGCVTDCTVGETYSEIDLPCMDDPAGLSDFTVGNASGNFSLTCFHLPNDASHDPITGLTMVFRRKLPILWIKESPQVSATAPIEAWYGTMTSLESSVSSGAAMQLSISGRNRSRHMMNVGA